MTEDFVIPVVHNGTAYEFAGWLLLQGYTHRIKVLVQGCEVFFEPDEENKYRAVQMPWQDETAFRKLTIGLVAAVGKEIDIILK